MNVDIKRNGDTWDITFKIGNEEFKTSIERSILSMEDEIMSIIRALTEIKDVKINVDFTKNSKTWVN